MYKSEPVLPAPEQMDVSPMELYLSAAELQPTENLPLEFSDVSPRVQLPYFHSDKCSFLMILSPSARILM